MHISIAFISTLSKTKINLLYTKILFFLYPRGQITLPLEWSVGECCVFGTLRGTRKNAQLLLLSLLLHVDTNHLPFKGLEKTREAMDLSRNVEARSSNHYSNWKPKSITYSENAFVALGIQHAIRMSHIAICGLPCTTVIFYFTL
jgi:hypothetical protein